MSQPNRNPNRNVVFPTHVAVSRGARKPGAKRRLDPGSFSLFAAFLSLAAIQGGCQVGDSEEPGFSAADADASPSPEGDAEATPGSSKSSNPAKASERIKSAGKFELPKDLSQATGDVEEEHGIPVSPGVTASCSTQGWTETEVREISDRIGLNLSGSKIYPGALLQGKRFEEGVYAPITIPRAKGTIYLTGINLDKGASYRAKNIEMSASSVNEAIQRLITEREVQGTSARSSYEEHVTHSGDEMLFRIGLDARFGVADVNASLSVGHEKNRNYVFVKFAQVFYDVSFEDPELSTSVFAQKERFKDPENQISAGNPPLYVSKVSFGRMVFFVAESTHNATEVKTALGAAVRGGLETVKASSGLTYKDILSRSRIYYYVVGGGADLALAPIKAANASEMFSAVKNFIGDRKSATFSADNPGAPIAYTLNYLSDRSPAKMAYSVNYDRRDCSFFHDSTDPEEKAIEVSFKGVEHVVVPEKAPGSGDTEFFGNGPDVEIRGAYKIVDEGVEFSLSMSAQETGSGDTHLYKKTKYMVYQVPKGWKVQSIQSQSQQRYRYIDRDFGVDRQEFGSHSLFKRLDIVGSAFGNDLGKTRVTAVLNPLRLRIKEK